MIPSNDPIFAAVKEHRAALAALNACRSDATARKAAERISAAERKIAATIPATLRGACAALRYARQASRSFPGETWLGHKLNLQFLASIEQSIAGHRRQSIGPAAAGRGARQRAPSSRRAVSR